MVIPNIATLNMEEFNKFEHSWLAIPHGTQGGTQAPGLTVKRSLLTLRKGAAGPTEECGDAAWGAGGAYTEVIPVLMSLEEHLQTEVAKPIPRSCGQQERGIPHTGHRAF